MHRILTVLAPLTPLYVLWGVWVASWLLAGLTAAPAARRPGGGAERMAVLYGCMLTAWSAAGVIGPQVVARLKDQYGGQAVGYAFACGTALLAAGFVLSITTSDAGRRGGEPGGAKL